MAGGAFAVSYRATDLLRMAGVLCLYLVLAKGSMAFVAQGSVAPLMCFPSGLALAALLLGGRKYWLSIWLGHYLADTFAGYAVVEAGLLATGHVLGVLFGLWLLRRGGEFDAALRRRQDFLQLLQAALISPLAGAVMGAVTLSASGRLAIHQLPEAMLQWWMGGLSGIMLLTPLLLIWRQPRMDWLRRERAAEFVCMLGLAFVCGQVVFLGWFRQTGGAYAEEYLMFIFVTWAGLRFGRHGVQLVILLALVQAWLGMRLGAGRFGSAAANVGLFRLWIYFVEMAAIGMALATTIREKNDIKNLISESEERFRAMFSKHSSVMVLVDPGSGRIVGANQAAVDFYGYPERVLTSMTMGQINTQPEKVAENIQRALREDGKYFTVIHRLRNGEDRVVNVYASPIEVLERTLLFSIVMDVTESRRMERELEKRANSDSLTGIPNRRRFLELAEQELGRALRYQAAFSLLLLDVDHFKQINDSCGHKGGDMALQALAGQCRQELRVVDVVGRFGGEEFAIMLPETGAEQALEVAERLRQGIAAMSIPLAHGGQLQMTVSIGVAALRGPVASIDDLLQQADQALYVAKQEGRNQVRSLAKGAPVTAPLFANDPATDAGQA
jgi:diguanylate cyclase (GGDEF)-like protein/PAS domain S-box-containing protein